EHYAGRAAKQLCESRAMTIANNAFPVGASYHGGNERANWLDHACFPRDCIDRVLTFVRSYQSIRRSLAMPDKKPRDLTAHYYEIAVHLDHGSTRGGHIQDHLGLARALSSKRAAPLVRTE
ncbi:unnamed protein product, partial [Prorocentrum cordatum]